MDIRSICDALSNRLQPIGGHAGVLDDTTIVLSWNVMQGLVVLSRHGDYFIKVSTPWGDSDTATTERAADISDLVLDLFQGFWERRGLKFKK